MLKWRYDVPKWEHPEYSTKPLITSSPLIKKNNKKTSKVKNYSIKDKLINKDNFTTPYSIK